MTDPLSVFTDHPEALYGVSHIGLSPEHRFNDPQYYMVSIGVTLKKKMVLY